MSYQHMSWVDHGQRVRGFYAHIGGRDHTHFVGKVVAYQSAPTVTVEASDGTRFHWAAHLCEPVADPEPHPCPLCPPRRVPDGVGPHDLCDVHRAQFEAWLEREETADADH